MRNRPALTLPYGVEIRVGATRMGKREGSEFVDFESDIYEVCMDIRRAKDDATVLGPPDV